MKVQNNVLIFFQNFQLLQLNYPSYLIPQLEFGIHNNKFFIFLYQLNELAFLDLKNTSGITQGLLKMHSNVPNSFIMPAADFLLMTDFMLEREILILA